MTDTLTPTTRNITRLFRKASTEEILAGVEWYDDAHRIAEILSVRYDVRIEKTAGVIAAVSPLQSWGANVNLASRIVENYTQGITTTAGYLSAGLDKAAKILAANEQTEPGAPSLSETVEAILFGKVGNKIANFYRSILTSGQEGVCVDRHAWSLAVGHRYGVNKETGVEETMPKIAGTRYEAAATAYVRAAKAINRDPRYVGLNVTPAQVQAVTWTLWRRMFWSDGAFDGATGQFSSGIVEKIW